MNISSINFEVICNMQSILFRFGAFYVYSILTHGAFLKMHKNAEKFFAIFFLCGATNLKARSTKRNLWKANLEKQNLT